MQPLTAAYAPRHPVVFKDPDDGVWRWICAECDWSAELDGHPNAYASAENHYIGMHLMDSGNQPWAFLGWF